jgi:hypothetical protein
MDRSVQELQVAGVGVLAVFAAGVLVWLYENILGFKLRKGSFNDRLVH